MYVYIYIYICTDIFSPPSQADASKRRRANLVEVVKGKVEEAEAVVLKMKEPARHMGKAYMGDFTMLPTTSSTSTFDFNNQLNFTPSGKSQDEGRI